jgi:hypothetical protein
MRLFSIFMLLCCSLHSLAQTSGIRNEFHLAADAEHQLTFSGEYYFASTALTNRIAGDYFLHRFITNETKNTVSSSLQSTNRYFAGFNGTFEYLYRPDSCRLNYIFTLQHHYFTDSQFSDDLFELYFRGNKGFSGATATLDASNFRSLLYYQAGFGVSGSSLSGQTNWYAIGSLLLGHDVLDIQTDKTRLYTSPDGEFIDADLDLMFRQSDSTANNPGAVNGTGFGMTAGFATHIGWKTALHVGVRNLGFIHFFDRSSVVRSDTSLRFEGIEVSDLFNFGDSVSSTVINDSAIVQQFLSDRRKEGFTIYTPGQIDLWLERPTGFHQSTVAIGMRQLISANARPISWCQLSYPVGAHTFRLHGQYGGYTEFTAGIGYEYERAGWKMVLSSDYLSAWLNSTKGRSQGAFVSLSKSF